MKPMPLDLNICLVLRTYLDLIRQSNHSLKHHGFHLSWLCPAKVFSTAREATWEAEQATSRHSSISRKSHQKQAKNIRENNRILLHKHPTPIAIRNTCSAIHVSSLAIFGYPGLQYLHPSSILCEVSSNISRLNMTFKHPICPPTKTFIQLPIFTVRLKFHVLTGFVLSCLTDNKYNHT